MRRPWGSYSQFKKRRGARPSSPLKLERLEDRLTLSHSAPPLEFESAAAAVDSGTARETSDDGHGAAFGTLSSTNLAEDHAASMGSLTNHVVGDAALNQESTAFSRQLAFDDQSTTAGGITGQQPRLGAPNVAASLSTDVTTANGQSDSGDYGSSLTVDTHSLGLAPSTSANGFSIAPLTMSPLNILHAGDQLFQFTPIAAANLELTMTIVVFNFEPFGQGPSPAGQSYELAGANQPAGLPAADAHAVHPRDTQQSVNAASGDQHAGPVAAVVPVTGDVLSRVVGATAEPVKTMTAMALPAATAQAAVAPSYLLNGVPPAVGLGGLATAPPASMNALDPPLSHAPQPVDGDRSVPGAAGDVEIARNVTGAPVAATPTPAAAALLSTASQRGDLLATLPINIEAVDRALDAVMSELGRLGGELATWLDDVNFSPWSEAAAVVAAYGAGTRYVRLRRARRTAEEESEEESSSWLFTRLQIPAGQP